MLQPSRPTVKLRAGVHLLVVNGEKDIPLFHIILRHSVMDQPTVQRLFMLRTCISFLCTSYRLQYFYVEMKKITIQCHFVHYSYLYKAV